MASLKAKEAATAVDFAPKNENGRYADPDPLLWLEFTFVQPPSRCWAREREYTHLRWLHYRRLEVGARHLEVRS